MRYEDTPSSTGHEANARLTRAERRILTNVSEGRNPFDGGGNGPTREVIRRLNREGYLLGHTMTAKGTEALK